MRHCMKHGFKILAACFAGLGKATMHMLCRMPEEACQTRRLVDSPAAIDVVIVENFKDGWP